MPAHFFERSLAGIVHAMEHASSSERIAAGRGWLQPLDARVKLLGAFATIVAVAIARNLATLAAVLTVAVVLAIGARVPARVLARAWLAVGIFSTLIVLPALFTTPGAALARVAGIAVTQQGVRSAAFLLLRVETTTTLALLLVASTSWPRLIAALRALRVPSAVVLTVAMTYRYVFVLLRGAEEMFVARRSRTVGKLDGPQRRRLATATAGVLLGKSLTLADDVYLAMRARGFRGEVQLLEDFRMRRSDWVAAVVCAAGVAFALWGGLR